MSLKLQFKKILLVLILITLLVSAFLLFKLEFNRSKKNQEATYFALKVFEYEEEKLLTKETESFDKECKKIKISEKIYQLDESVFKTTNHELTWREFFIGNGFKFSDEPLPVTYLNDLNYPGLLDKKISDLDSAVFIFGTTEDLDAKRDQAVKLDYIQEIKKVTENCGV